MKHVIFVDEYNSSIQNGIGTFRDQLLPRLGTSPGIKTTLISLNSMESDVKRRKTLFGNELRIPMVNSGNWRGIGGLICPVLRTYIPDRDWNVFILNHSPCSNFIKSLRESFPKSKIIFVIHDQGWCAPLLGSVSLLKDILLKKIIPKGFSREVISHVVESYKEEVEIYSNVDYIVCISRSTFKIVAEVYGINEAKLRLIPNGLDADGLSLENKLAIRKSLGIMSHEKLIIFSGRPARYKGIEPMLIAFESLQNTIPDIRLVICGSLDGFGKFSRLLEPIASRVTFTGLLSQEKLAEWYKASDVGLLPSYSEQFGYSAFEMIKYGLPIVVSDGNGLRDLFTDGVNALVAQIGNVIDSSGFVKSLTQSLETVLTMSPLQLRGIQDEARELLTYYSTENMVQKYLQVIREK
ncbi:MAG: glycosyltransferase [Bacteroides sp.]|nr:glycosyltransferase [Bacteroides sp.]